ncbi:MAG: hypothetical protein U0R21_08440 [Nocardioidaceae bacterium]
MEPFAHGSLAGHWSVFLVGDQLSRPRAALALVGAARRLGIQAKSREVRGVDRVVIRDGDAIGQMLTVWVLMPRPCSPGKSGACGVKVRTTANPATGDANLGADQSAAVPQVLGFSALEILGEEIPDHLRQAGTLRPEHKQASLEEIGATQRPGPNQGCDCRSDPSIVGHGGSAC